MEKGWKRYGMVLGVIAVLAFCGICRAGGDPYVGDVDVMAERGKVRVLTTYNRTNFFLARGEPQGLEFELLKPFETFAKQRGYGLTFQFIPTTRDKLLPGLAAGHGDIAAAALTITPARKKQADFTVPYVTGVSEVLVTHKAVPSPASAEALSGKTLFIRPSSSYHESIMALNEKLERAGKPAVIVKSAPEYLETEDILEMVNSGAVKMTVCDSNLAAIWATVMKDLRVRKEVRFRENARIAFMVRKDSPELRRLLDEYLAERHKGTFSGDALIGRYYRKNPWIKSPLHNNTGKQFRDNRELMVREGKAADFDWLMLMALAYQASGFDQSKTEGDRVGQMQVDRAALKAQGVKTDDLTDLADREQNIVAAVRLLAHYRDEHFREPGVEELERVLFALAAYRLGPDEVDNARAKARELGLDPNQWFRNVEIAMAQITNEEEARYVSNVSKYHLIYRMADEAGQLAAQ